MCNSSTNYMLPIIAINSNMNKQYVKYISNINTVSY